MHRLKLNDDKTEFVYLASLNSTKSISMEPITIGDIFIPPTSSARDIGVIFDSTFQMDAQAGKVCQACYFLLKNIHRARSSSHWLFQDQTTATHFYMVCQSISSQGYSTFKMRPQE